MKFSRSLPALLPLALSAMAQAESVKLNDIQVIGHQEGQTLVDFIPSVTTLKGKELQKKRQTSLGDTLSNEAGVTSTQFGPSASRPVIRGLDGDRIRILQNSLGTMDASTQSLDHAIPVDTLTVDQIEIVRGPMSLLYGSSAVGGVVNIVTNRIHSEYEEGFSSQLLTQGETVNNGLSNALQVNYGANNWMFHVDGSTRNLQNQKIPNYARSSKKRQTDPQADEARDKLPDSFNQQDNMAVGVSRIFDKGYLGLSYNHFNTTYGVVAEEDVSIDMIQNRFELAGEYKPSTPLFRKVKFKAAQSDYRHREVADHAGHAHEPTIFKNKGNETRLEGINKWGDLEGVVGLQTQVFTFKASGEEAFLPSTSNHKLSAFTYQELKKEKNVYSAGARIENTDIEKKASADFGPKDSKNYVGLNASLGHQYKFTAENSFSTSLSYTERAPNFQELYSNGPHAATGSFEIGSDTLKKEKATAVELSFKSHTTKNQFTFNVYSQFFNDFVALNPTGNTRTVDGEDFDEYAYTQVDAVFYGLDIDNKNNLAMIDNGQLSLVNKFDIVRAKDKDSGDNISRISPPRLSAGLEYAKEKWTADIEAQYVFDQTKIAQNETRTKAYTLTNLGYSYKFMGQSSALSLFARVRNIFDVEARNHVSFLKEIAPLPGRNFILGAQIQL